MERLLGVTPGSATILALMNDKDHQVRLILDKSVAEPGVTPSSRSISSAGAKERREEPIWAESSLVRKGFWPSISSR